MPRNAKPQALQERRGHPDKRPRRIVQHLPGCPEPPAGLPPEALSEWRRLTELLSARGDLSELDQAALADYCLCRIRLEECERLIAEQGVLVRGQRGLVKNPALQIARQYRAALQKWSDLFGLTPASRGKINIPRQEIDDDPDGMFS
jgi:P27 family predicted phage terminase small subunit